MEVEMVVANSHDTPENFGMLGSDRIRLKTESYSE